MKPQEINRVAQYVTARTSYSREDTTTILETTFSELSALAETSAETYQRSHVLEYVTHWTIRQTNFPEPMIREILECAGKWLDEICQTVETPQPEHFDPADN